MRTRPTSARLFGAAPVTPYPKDGINDHVIHGAATVNPDRRGTKCAFWYRLEVPAGRHGRSCGSGCARTQGRTATGGRGPRRRTSSGSSPPGGPRPTSSTPSSRRRRATADEAIVMRQAFSGMLWSKQFYHYDVARWLDGDPTQPPRRAARHARPQRPVAQLQLVRHHVDAGQVGVPVVRRLGPGVPLCGAGARGPGVREVPADPAVPGVVPASQRRAARLRVGLRRRQPAGAGVGRAGGVRHRRRPRPRLPEPGLRQAPDQLHLVGEPGGRRGQQPVRGRLPRAGQHRPDRPLPPAAPATRWSSPTPPAGWRSTRWPWRASRPC